MAKITFGFSTCPNDTFIFDALYNRKINWQGLDFEFVLADVEELNQMALSGKIDVTKISYHSYGLVANNYILSNYGSALGKNNGPLVIAKSAGSITDFFNKKVGIPGEHTTANLLLSIAFPQIKNKTPYLFSDIEDAILNREIDAGLIIHETRFTYQKKGLVKIIDMGEWWEKQWQLPLPLGGICIKREIEDDVISKINTLIQQSIEFGFANPVSSLPFIKHHAQAMEESVMRKHIELYVNEYTRNIGITGKKSVEHLLKNAAELSIFEATNKPLFVL